jgi:hypothetical protein
LACASLPLKYKEVFIKPSFAHPSGFQSLQKKKVLKNEEDIRLELERERSRANFQKKE